MISKPQTWDSINENGARRLPMGGYVAQIKKVTDFPDKEYFEVEYEIVEGEYKGIALEAYEAWGRWSYSFRVYYTQKSLWKLKKFIIRVEQTNAGFEYDWGNVQCLVGKGIGLIIGTRQYWGKDGNLKDAPDVQDFCTANEVREGNLPTEPKTREPSQPAPQPVMETMSTAEEPDDLSF